MSDDVVVLTRRFACAPERLFDCWLDPAALRAFLCPGTAVLGRLEVNPVVGGGFSFDALHDGKVIPHEGTYLVIDRPVRLVFTWTSPHTDGETLVTLDLVTRQGATDLTLRHERLPERMRMAHRQGWSSILEKLALHVEAT